MNTKADNYRRRFLITATGIVGGAGFIAFTVPFVSSMNPGARARSRGAPVRVDMSKLIVGQQITVKWRGQPVWVLRRSPLMLENLSTAKFRQHLRDPDSRVDTQQPDYARNEYRSIESEYLVVIGICTHLGCVPTFRPIVFSQAQKSWLVRTVRMSELAIDSRLSFGRQKIERTHMVKPDIQIRHCCY